MAASVNETWRFGSPDREIFPDNHAHDAGQHGS
jgi:hypothetical protein